MKVDPSRGGPTLHAVAAPLGATMVTQISHLHADNSISILVTLNQILIDSNYTFPIDLAPSGNPFGAKLIGNV